MEKNKSYIERVVFRIVVKRVADFLIPVMFAIRDGIPFAKKWKPGGPWS